MDHKTTFGGNENVYIVELVSQLSKLKMCPYQRCTIYKLYLEKVGAKVKSDERF